MTDLVPENPTMPPAMPGDVTTRAPQGTAAAAPQDTTTFAIIAALSVCHMLNDVMQSLLVGIYPILKTEYGLDFAQIGMMTLVFQVTASLLQPLVGIYTDRHPQPYSLAIAMGSTFCGLILLAYTQTYGNMLIACAMIGLGSAVFHPEASRIARLASGGRHGLAQSLFQVGGNFGSALGPLLAAFIVLPHGQKSVAWFCAAALLAMLILWQVGNWYAGRQRSSGGRVVLSVPTGLSRGRVTGAITVLGLLVFSKYIYLASLTNYYTFYVIEKFDLSIRNSQLLLFVFLAAVAAGTVIGGPVGDRIGRKAVIWVSILGVLPFTVLLPHANLFWTVMLTIVIGVILASAFSAILVFAQDLVPGKVGLMAGLFFGFAFGIAGIGAALLGELSDAVGIETVFRLCAWLPAIGILTILLPDIGRR